jgi:hypothetical protein
LVASGFLVLAIRESMILSGASMDLAASAPSFGAGSGLWPWPWRSSVFRAPFLSLCESSGWVLPYSSQRRHCKSSRDSAPSHFLPSAVLCLSVLHCDLLRVDLDAGENCRSAKICEMRPVAMRRQWDQQLSGESSRLTGRYPPRCPVLQHRVENREELLHVGRQGELLRLPRLTQALIEAPITEFFLVATSAAM